MLSRTLNARVGLRIRARFVIVLSLLVVGTGALGAIALSGLSDLRHSNEGLRSAVSQSTVNGHVNAGLILFAAQLQLYVGTNDRALARELHREIQANIVDLEGGLAAMRRAAGRTASERATAREQARAYRTLLAMWRDDSLTPGTKSAARMQHLMHEVHEEVDPMVAAAETVQRRDLRVAAAAAAAADARYRATRTLIIEALIGLLVASVMLAVWLVRSVVPRARRYADFAGRVSSGDLGARLDPRGIDELDDLGRSLDALAAKRRSAETYAETQSEFNDALQVAEGEEEAHLVLRAHLQRSIPSSSVVVLNRNNSADRLEARTPVEPGPLAEGLGGAGPR
ncbi:MAG TPA: HAMP domain-containing protein, partial [Solirubrobacteraceae bacterium]|nr:HAMP domain-containing protein [Solirubrobacteraceae bacterium]